jgi:hypothetical protein
MERQSLHKPATRFACMLDRMASQQHNGVFLVLLPVDLVRDQSRRLQSGWKKAITQRIDAARL